MRQPAQSPRPILKSPAPSPPVCRICGGFLKEVIPFGPMPLANAFLKAEDFEREFFFNLAAGICTQCAMFQLMEQPDPEKMFHDQYPFYTGSSSRMAEHFRRWAQILKASFLKPQSLIVEIGSNDGTFLQNFQPEYRSLGVEPSANVAAKALEKGVPTKVCFFNKAAAEEIYGEFGPAEVIAAANCLCHIPDPASVFAGIHRLLADTGMVVLEDPYLGDVLAKTAYDQIYDEHVFLFSVTSMAEMLSRAGFEIFDLEPQWTHGGSMRYFVCRKGQRAVSPRISDWLEKENRLGLKTLLVYEKFQSRCEESRRRLLECLQSFKRQSIAVAGYGATSKSTTVLNYCGIGPDLMGSIFDTTPAKQGKWTPGTHIPIRPYEVLQKNYPQAMVLFAWNHAEEIFKKESRFREAGGKWIRYVPEVCIE